MVGQNTNRLLELLKDEGLDALIFFGLPNIRYLSGFSGTDGLLFVTAQETVFLTDSRYHDQAQEQVRSDRIVCYRDKIEAIGKLLTDHCARCVGFEADQITVAQYDALKNALPDIDWQPLSRELQELRGVKSAQELIWLQQAADLNRQAFDEILPRIAPGISEHEIALELEIALKRHGGEAKAFDFIVASGGRGAMPHGVASHKKIAAGELLTIDFGTRVNGYHSDETVTLAIGDKIDGNLRQIFDIVLEAHDLAMNAVRPGLAVADLDAVARDVIGGRGFGDFFGHGLGHGVGLEIHEFPGLSPRSDAVLAEGMVITIEPGIYLPGSGGVRIEDTVVVTTNGCRPLTSIPKSFRSTSGSTL